MYFSVIITSLKPYLMHFILLFISPYAEDCFQGNELFGRAKSILRKCGKLIFLNEPYTFIVGPIATKFKQYAEIYKLEGSVLQNFEILSE